VGTAAREQHQAIQALAALAAAVVAGDAQQAVRQLETIRAAASKTDDDMEA
jgi:hypothetical protein